MFNTFFWKNSFFVNIVKFFLVRVLLRVGKEVGRVGDNRFRFIKR